MTKALTRFMEDHVEQAALAYLAELGYTCVHANTLGPDNVPAPERASYADVVLKERLKQAIARLNPTIPADAQHEALQKLLATEKANLTEENRRLHKLLVEGVPVEYTTDNGRIKGDVVRLLDAEQPGNNDWLAVNQLTVIEHGANRRPDVVTFVNGLPVGVIELKNPGDENATLDGAYNQLQNYKSQIPSLFRFNGVLITSDGITARVGSLTANKERFMPWRTVDGVGLMPKGQPELETVIKGVFEPGRLLDLVCHFTLFGQVETKDNQLETIKIVAGYHQYHAVNKAVEATIQATRPTGNRKIGVIWHTQGSGKSLLMAFYAGQVIQHPAMENPTIVILTDRNDLDDQLFGTFTMCKDLLRQTPEQADNRQELKTLLSRPSGGVIFTTIQKFSPDEGNEYPVLTNRSNVIVMADEAHRSQYGFKAKVKVNEETKEAEVAYGFAKYLRDAIPNASFIGFTGTPIEASDVNTPAVFGDYIDVYDITQAVEDGATVPIYYESRLIRVELDDEGQKALDAYGKEIDEDDDSLKTRLLEKLVGSDERLTMLASDLVNHLEGRLDSLDGKAMAVCMSRRICVALYNKIKELRPEWHNDDDDKGVVKVIMSGSRSDPENWQPHIGKRPKTRRDNLAKRAKDTNDELKLVIVRDMWLTGFDSPSMHTMYVDKPMQGHGLMQAIARVNRVFKDKPAGLVVDYIGIAQNLRKALSNYSNPQDRDNTGIDQALAIQVMMEKYGIVRDMFSPAHAHGFDYRPALNNSTSPTERLRIMAGAMDWILSQQHKAAEQEDTEEGKKQAHKRYALAVAELSKAFSLASASDEAKSIREDVAFFQAVRSALVKSTGAITVSKADRELAIQQLVSRAVISTEIVDILKAAGLKSPDISILSDDFLMEIAEMEQKNLALEALRKLLNGEIKVQAGMNVARARALSERLQEAMAKYHNNAISTMEVIVLLVDIAHDFKKSRQEGEESDLSPEEIAFYDALAENKSAKDIMGEPQLRAIAHLLVEQLRANVTVDWATMDSARARIRVLVKRILIKHGYPPDLQDAAIQTVLQQAETISDRWV